MGPLYTGLFLADFINYRFSSVPEGCKVKGGNFLPGLLSRITISMTFSYSPDIISEPVTPPCPQGGAVFVSQTK